MQRNSKENFKVLIASGYMAQVTTSLTPAERIFEALEGALE